VPVAAVAGTPRHGCGAPAAPRSRRHSSHSHQQVPITLTQRRAGTQRTSSRRQDGVGAVPASRGRSAPPTPAGTLRETPLATEMHSPPRQCPSTHLPCFVLLHLCICSGEGINIYLLTSQRGFLNSSQSILKLIYGAQQRKKAERRNYFVLILHNAVPRCTKEIFSG